MKHILLTKAMLNPVFPHVTSKLHQYTIPATFERWYYYISLVLFQFYFLSNAIFTIDYSESIRPSSCIAIVSGKDCYIVDMV